MRRAAIPVGSVLAALAVVGLAGGALLGTAPAPLEGPRLLEVVADVALAAILIALLVALWAVRGHARRIERISAALATWERGDPGRGLRIDDAGTDEVAELAAQVERVAARAAEQAARVDAAEREREELLSNVAHDLRTPLASMRGYLELILVRDGAALGVDARNDLQTAVRQAERLGRRVADLLELARLDGDARTESHEAFGVAELAHDIAARHAGEAARRGVRLAVDTCDAQLRVEADLAGVERVLAELLDNALRHTPRGGSVRVEAHADTPRARISVVDDGEGLDAVALAGVFDRYRRAARTGPPDHAGGHGGLGLAIARRIVERHGGTLDLQSAPGCGTRAMFDLPLAPAPSPPTRQEAA